MMPREQLEYQVRIRRELRRREYARSFLKFLSACHIEAKGESGGMGVDIPFRLWPAQERILPHFLSAPLLVILKARQLGLTWLTAAYALWVAGLQRGKLIVVISAKEDWAVEFLDRVRFMRSRLPGWLLPRTDKDGGQHMRFVHKLGPDGKPLEYSEIKSLATTPEGAQSKTPDLLVMDETARNRYAKEIFGSSYPGIQKAGGRVIVISNSHKNGVGWSWTRDLYTGSMRGENEFQRIFMPWWDCPERISEAEAAKLAVTPSGIDQYGQVIARQFKTTMLQSGYDEDDFSQNYPESEQEAISALTGSYFGTTLARHTTTIRGDIGNIITTDRDEVCFSEHPKGMVEVWRYPYHLVAGWDEIPWTRRYCIGSDVSEGLGQSYSVAYVYDRLLSEFVARLRSNRVDAHTWGDLLWALSNYYCYGRGIGSGRVEAEPALICVETTGAGQTTVKRLKDLGANLYRQQGAPQAGSEMTIRYGWNESNQAKHDLSEDLRAWMRKTTGTVYDRLLLDECSTWIKHESGKIGPGESKLGDCVIAAGLAIQADQYMGGSPERILPPMTGWRARFNEKRVEFVI